MRFREKLDFLIRVFNSNNSKLAKALKVDPSLISKWRNGGRALSSNSVYVPMIIEYFLNIASMQNQKDTLIEILKQLYPDIDESNQAQLHSLFRQWVLSTEDACEFKSNLFKYAKEINTDNKNIALIDIDVNAGFSNIITKFNEFSMLSQNNSNTNNIPPVFFNAWAKNGEKGAYELFKGKDGKRQIILNILAKLYLTKEPAELFFLDEASFEWLIEDKDFFMLFCNSLKELISMGHKITAVHHVMRPPSQLAPLIDFWLPLYMTGAVASFYYPKYTDSTHKKTMYIIHGQAAAFSITSRVATDTSTILMFEEPMVVAVIEEIYKSYLSKCRPLIKTYTHANYGDLHKEIYSLEEKSATTYILKSKLSSISIPLTVYSGLLDKLQLSSDEKNERLNLHDKRTRNFMHNICCNKYVEYINTEIYDKYNPELIFKYDSPELFAKDGVVCEPDDIIAHLKNMIDLLKTYNNYEVIFIKLNDIIHQNRATISCQEGSYAIATTCDIDGNNPVTMVLTEPCIIKVFEHYLTGLADYIPEHEINKNYTIKRLEAIIFMLESRMS